MFLMPSARSSTVLYLTNHLVPERKGKEHALYLVYQYLHHEERLADSIGTAH